MLLVLERVELAAREVDLEVPLRSIAPVVEILPLRVLEPEPESVRLPSLVASVKAVVSY